MSFPDNFICPITQTVMTDPVIGNDGITYERDAITQWLQSHNTSPVTRNIMSLNLIPNIALRNTIQDYFKQNTTNGFAQSTQIQSIQKQSTNIEKNIVDFSYDVKNGIFNGEQYSICTLNFKNSSKKNNIIVAVVDNSGSMGESADVPGAESSGLTRLDLVKHTLNTFVHSLSDNDMMCIIKFSNNAYVVSDFIKLNRTGKDITIENIKKIQPDGMTNMWAGIKLGIDKISSVFNNDYNISMILMTDGVSNSDPPRGIIPTLEEYIKTKNINFSINTFGYGYNIDSLLLGNIAKMCNGIFGFIPDATMVGTIFINMISSIINGCVNNLTLQYQTFLNGTNTVNNTSYGMISHNQPIHIVIKNICKLNNICKLKFNGLEKDIDFSSNIQTFSSEDINQIVRLKLIDTINIAITQKNSTSLFNLKKYLENINKTYNSSYINDVIDDIDFDDPNKGQLVKAVSKPDWFDQWGSHYLKAISRAHQLERCITFKELSPQHYMSEELKTEQKRIEQIFCDLSAPEPSGYRYSYSSNNTYSQPVSMQTYYVQDGGCFDGLGMVSMYDIKQEKIYYKKVNEITEGDIVYCPLKKTKYAIVECVVRIKMMKFIKMCDLNNMKITPFHPIMKNDEWVFPNNVHESVITFMDYVYDFVLDSGHCVEINNTNVITLGHGFTSNDVVKHEYFGDKIIDDLIKHSGWKNGFIDIEKFEFERDEDMRIVKMIF
jgi:hypothetical protein